MTQTTVLTRYEYALSLIFVTVIVTSRPYLEAPDRRYFRFAAIKYSLMSLLFGLWAFPWGLLCTLWSIGANFAGGREQTVASELMRLKWGWRAPSDIGGHAKDVIELTPRAAAEIDRRRTVGSYPSGVGVRIQLAEAHGTTCLVEFDFPASDGRDWVGTAQGHTVLVDKEDAEFLKGNTVDFLDGEFVINAPLG